MFVVLLEATKVNRQPFDQSDWNHHQSPRKKKKCVNFPSNFVLFLPICPKEPNRHFLFLQRPRLTLKRPTAEAFRNLFQQLQHEWLDPLLKPKRCVKFPKKSQKFPFFFSFFAFFNVEFST